MHACICAFLQFRHWLELSFTRRSVESFLPIWCLRNFHNEQNFALSCSCHNQNFAFKFKAEELSGVSLKIWYRKAKSFSADGDKQNSHRPCSGVILSFVRWDEQWIRTGEATVFIICSDSDDYVHKSVRVHDSQWNVELDSCQRARNICSSEQSEPIRHDSCWRQVVESLNFSRSRL